VAISPRTRIDSFEVVDAASDTMSMSLARLTEALRVIGEYAPAVLARLRRDIRRFLIVGAGGPEYWPHANGVALAGAPTAASRPEELALVLVHEAAHARITRAGIPYIPALRERIERICVAAEVAFAAKLPDSDYWMEFAAAKLADPWWTDERVRARRARARGELARQNKADRALE
jgi:hypothetical protein